MATYQESPLAVQIRVIGALMLRDTRTRVGRTFFGFAFVVLKPLSHLLFLMTMFLFIRGRLALVGTSPAVFWATGLLPYILCLYPARMMMHSLVESRPLLFFPIVKPIDVIVARGVVEILTAFWVCLIFGIILLSFSVDIVPLSYFDALAAILATIYLGFCMGFFCAVAFKLTRAWGVIMMIGLVVMYFTSGVFFIPSLLPPQFQYFIWFNPLLHCVEWMRSAYYDGFGYGLLSRTYLFSYATMSLFLGLLLEKAARGRVLQQ